MTDAQLAAAGGSSEMEQSSLLVRGLPKDVHFCGTRVEPLMFPRFQQQDLGSFYEFLQS